MNGNEIKEATFEDALYCAKALVGVERCEECRFYTLGDLWCDDTYRIMHEALEEVKAYRAIGTVEEFKALKEKNEPKKAIGKRKYDEAYCPACNEVISDGEFWALDEYVHHCNYCGQAVKGVDWQ